MRLKVVERSQPLAEKIVEALEEAIISGRLLPRERLVELELAAQYDVSRAPVREALRMLERDGLVSKTTRGFAVTDVTAEAAAEIFEILAHLEELYTRSAATEDWRSRARPASSYPCKHGGCGACERRGAVLQFKPRLPFRDPERLS